MRFREFLVLAAACFGLLPSVAQAASLAEYLELSHEVGTFPLTLISAEGEAYSFAGDGTADGTRKFVVLDQGGRPTRLPEGAIFDAIPGEPGAYLLRGNIAGRLTVWHALLTAGELRLSRPIEEVSNQDALTALGPGAFAVHRLDRGTHGSISFFQTSTDGAPVEQAVRYNARSIGPVLHPVTGEAGLAISPWSNSNYIDLYFPTSAPIKLQFPPIISVFAASAKGILVGVRRRTCESQPGLPQGLCSPDLFIVLPPDQDRQYQRSEIASFRHVAKQVPDVTFGFDSPLKTDSDFKMVGDTLLVIAKRGPQQELLEFSLKVRREPVVRIPMRDGIELQFGTASGPVGNETVTVIKKSYLRPWQTIGVKLGSAESQIATQGQPFERIEAIDLAVKTVDNRVPDGLPPFTLVGRRDALGKDYCDGGPALIEAYGASRVPLNPFNVLGLVPSLFDGGGIYVAAHVSGSGGFGQPWGQRGNYGDNPRQIEELINLVGELRKKGCQEVVLIGQSYGGNLVLRTGLSYPQKVNRIIAAITPLDIKREYEAGNRAVSALLPRDWSTVSDADIASVSPRALAQQAADLSDLSITLIAGEFDDQISTDKDERSIQAMREKGAKVRLVVQPGVGHSRYATLDQWSKYWFVIGEALAD